MYRFVLVAFVAVSLPMLSHASVVISEVAWMGNKENANAEWIELYNNGPKQDVTGWSLSATDGKPNTLLSGSIPANTYVLLERTSDNTVPSRTAFLVYTGGLGNTGETLELRDDSGTIIDSVDGSNSWALGGNNDTKETLQRFGEPAIGGFGTAPETPGKGGSTPPKPKTPPTPAPTQTERTTTRTAPAVSKVVSEQSTPPVQPRPASSTESTVTDVVTTNTASRATAIAYAFADDEKGDGHENPLWWYLLGLIAAILATIVTVLLVRQRQQPEVIAGFEIESDE